MVLSNAKAVRMAVPYDYEATRFHLCPESLSLSRLGSCRITCQTIEVFIVESEIFDFLHERCVGGGEKGNGNGEFLDHRLFVGGGVRQVVEIALKCFVLDGFSS